MDMKRIIIRNMFLLCVYILLCLGCDNKVKCIGCEGTGIFVYNGGSVTCAFCKGEGEVPKSKMEALLPGGEMDDDPVHTGSYCTFCMGTGKFKTNMFPFESQCSMCGGRGVSDNPQNNSNAPLYRCVFCEGGGKNPFGGGTCTFCNGYGISLLSPSDQDRMIERSMGPQGSQSLCGACGGSGVCPVCKSSGGAKYGDMQYCSVCGNTRRCPWCHGRGIK